MWHLSFVIKYRIFFFHSFPKKRCTIFKGPTMSKFNLYKIVNTVLRFLSLYTGAASLSDCLPCTGGYYCAGNGLTSPTGLCAAGYYCPDNETISSATPSSFLCPSNYKCPEGSAKPEPCLSGEFQANMGMSVCSKCPAGFYCNTTGNVPIKYDCPPFHYCPEGEF